jgi:hypothetical protein
LKKETSVYIDDLDNFLSLPLNKQNVIIESTLGKLDDDEFAIIDILCRKIVKKLQYNNIRSRVEYSDGMEILAKLGMFLSLNTKDNKHG